MGLHEETKAKIERCLQQEALSGKLPKGSAVNPHRIGVICGGDPRTAELHMPELMGLELEGLNFSGKLRPLNESAGPWAIVDPPQDTRMDGVSERQEPSLGSTLIIFGLGLAALAGGLALAAACRSIFTCTACGTQLDVTGWDEPGFSCPNCATQYARQNS
jgi:hypothetical protein